MIDVESKMFTTIKYMVQKSYPKATVVDFTQTSKPTSFPCVVVQMLDNPVTTTDLENEEVAVTSMFQCEVYMNGSSAKVTSKKIEAIVNDAMQFKGFRRSYGWTTIENVTDKTILRRTARYQRVVANEDEI